MKTGVKPRNLLDVAKGSLPLPSLQSEVRGPRDVRITHKYQPKNWLAGPSGFMMIVGCLLVAVFVFEVVVRCLRYPKGRTGEVQSAQAKAQRCDANRGNRRIREHRPSCRSQRAGFTSTACAPIALACSSCTRY